MKRIAAISLSFFLLLATCEVVILSLGAQQSAERLKGISGSVADQSGGAIAGAHVTIADDRGTLLKTTTDANGNFSFSRLPPGRYSIQVESGNFEQARMEVEVTENEPAPTVRILLKVKPVQEQLTVTTAGYSVTEATAATKTDAPILKTPVSIQVVPARILEDQRANTLTSALENVSGVRSYNNDVEGYTFNIRGFESLNMFRNSLVEGYQVATIKETANVEQIEVLKGPSSTLFGRIDPGGVINRVTKKPLSAPHYGVEQEFGSYNHFRTQWDVTGPLGAGDTFGYRVSGAFQDFDSFRDFQGGRRVFLAPALAWKRGAATSLNVEGEYLTNRAQSDMGQPAIGTLPADIPISRSFQESNDPRDRTESFLLGYEFKHHLARDWTITNRFHHSEGVQFEKLNIAPTDIQSDERTLDRVIQFQTLPNGRIDTTNLDLTGTFRALGGTHHLLVGFDFLSNYTDYEYAENPTTSIDIFEPVYGTIPSTDITRAFAESGFTFFSATENKQAGLYVQDRIALLEKWNILLGGRYDWARLGTGRSTSSATDARADFDLQPADKDNRFSPRAGVMYQAARRVGLYGNFSQSFGANNGVTATGTRVDPEIGRQWEGGAKFATLDGRISATLAVYRLTKSNVLTPDLTTPDPTDVIAIGETRSRGLEFDVLGQVTQRLNLIGNYAYTDAEIIKDNSGLQGKTPRGVPRSAGSVFLIYDFGHAGFGWRLGGGVTGAGDRPGDADNSFILPAYARLDALVSYRRKWGPATWTAQLNVQNLANTEYYVGTDIFYNYSFSPRTNIFPGAARTITMTLKLGL